MSRFFEAGVSASRTNRTFQRQLREYEQKRVSALMGYVAAESAKFVHAQVVAHTTGTELEPIYRRGLRVSNVSGVSPKDGVAYTVAVSPKADRITSVMAKKTILFVIPRTSILTPPRPEVLVLRHHGPWTAETLPFVPSPRDAKLFYRPVSEKEAQAVADKQNDVTQRRKIDELLTKIGFRPPNRSQRVKTPANVSAVPDAAYLGYRLEYGIGGSKKVPHWRPALSALKGGGLKQILSSRDFKDGMGKMASSGWRRWPPRMSDEVSPQSAKIFKPFEKRLGTK